MKRTLYRSCPRYPFLKMIYFTIRKILNVSKKIFMQ